LKLTKLIFLFLKITATKIAELYQHEKSGEKSTGRDGASEEVAAKNLLDA